MIEWLYYDAKVIAAVKSEWNDEGAFVLLLFLAGFCYDIY